MKQILFPALLLALTVSCTLSQPKLYRTTLFNGKNFKGWQGDTLNTWKIKDGVIAGGSLTEKVPHNEFLSTLKSYSNYSLKLKFKLTGTEGFINGGVQFHSQRISNPPYEMTGYQADLGDKYWASLYDESRRNKLLVTADMEKIKKILKQNDWNDYEIRTTGKRIQVFLNGEQTVDYLEPDNSIPQSGLIALQVHGGGKVEVFYKDLILEELPLPKK